VESGRDSAAALEAHETALAMDPNAVIHTWMSAIRLADFGRHDEAIARLRAQVELTQRGHSSSGCIARSLACGPSRRSVGHSRRAARYVRSRVCRTGGDVDDGRTRHRRRRGDRRAPSANVDAMTGPTAIVTTVVRELEPLLDHPRLGPLVRRLTSGRLVLRGAAR
jgi:hypothetical protein